MWVSPGHNGPIALVEGGGHRHLQSLLGLHGANPSANNLSARRSLKRFWFQPYLKGERCLASLSLLGFIHGTRIEAKSGSTVVKSEEREFKVSLPSRQYGYAR